MLPPYIIEELRKREQHREQQQEQPRLELPIPERRRRDSQQPDDGDRGITIIPLWE